MTQSDWERLTDHTIRCEWCSRSIKETRLEVLRDEEDLAEGIRQEYLCIDQDECHRTQLRKDYA